MFAIRPVARAASRLVGGGKTEPPFDPATLFENGEQGFWLDPSDLSTMFQDAAGTVPVTEIGQPVGLILDKSGRGNHASQATSASRPILRKNATTGFNYLEFDGIDDYLTISQIRTLKNPFNASFALNASNVVNNTTRALLATTAATVGWIYIAGTRAFSQQITGDPILRAERNDLDTLTFVYSGKKVSIESNLEYAESMELVGVTPFNNEGTLIVGARSLAPTFVVSMQLYGLIAVQKATTDQEYTNIRKYLNKKVGTT